MTVQSSLSRVRSVIQTALEIRASEHDEVEWECGMSLIRVQAGGVTETVPSVFIIIKLSRFDNQDCGIDTNVFENIPLDLCTTDFLTEWLDHTWDALVLRGLEVSLD